MCVLSIPSTDVAGVLLPFLTRSVRTVLKEWLQTASTIRGGATTNQTRFSPMDLVMAHLPSPCLELPAGLNHNRVPLLLV